MDRKWLYRKTIEEVLQDYNFTNLENVESKLVIDREGDHYQVLLVGWQGKRRIFCPLIYIDLIGDRIWIQHDGTEEGVALDLVDSGVPKSDIVLAFHSRQMREHTDYAVE